MKAMCDILAALREVYGLLIRLPLASSKLEGLGNEADARESFATAMYLMILPSSWDTPCQEPLSGTQMSLSQRQRYKGPDIRYFLWQKATLLELNAG